MNEAKVMRSDWDTSSLSKAMTHDENRVVVREIEHNSEEYAEMVALRNRVLREPLGLRLTDEQLGSETDDVLIVAYVGTRMAGCLILTAEGEGTAVMRQVGVDESMRQIGVGRRLVRFAEKAAHRHGFHRLILHARETAIPFYQKLGYEVISDTYIEVTLPHRTMRKILT